MIRNQSPERATVMTVAPLGLRNRRIRNQGLTPLAIDYRPFGPAAATCIILQDSGGATCRC